MFVHTMNGATVLEMSVVVGCAFFARFAARRGQQMLRHARRRLDGPRRFDELAIARGVRSSYDGLPYRDHVTLAGVRYRGACEPPDPPEAIFARLPHAGLIVKRPR